jgi:hypothetical protein
MNGRAPFETIIDVVGAVFTMIAIGVVAGTRANVSDKPTLVSVAWIQVIASIVKFICKVAYVCLKGWFQPYRNGFFGKLTLLVSSPIAVRACWKVFSHRTDAKSSPGYACCWWVHPLCCPPFHWVTHRVAGGES